MGVVPFMRDGLRNLVANLGTSRDKAAGSYYAAPVINYEELVAAYRGAWLPRKIVDIPALDATRRWRSWQAKADQISAIESEERRLQLREKTLQAMTVARLYGGSALYIGTGDSDQSEPLDPAKVTRGGLTYVTVLGPRTLSPGRIDMDPESEWFNRPAYYDLITPGAGHVRIHPSRLAVFVGAALPEDGVTYAQHSGWGDPVLLSIMDAIKHADSTTSNIASLVFESKIDVIGVPDLARHMQDARGEELLTSRFQLAAMMKGINGTLVMDAEETYNQKSANFANLPDVMDRFFQIVSGAADIPMTRLFGQSAAGLNATGESDLRNYYDRVQSLQEIEMSPAMWRLDEALIRSALGVRPPEVHYNWSSLWQTTDRERAEIGKLTAETAKALSESKLFAPEALSTATANALIEGGTLPGLEAAIEEFGAFPEEEDPADLAAALTPPSAPTDPAAPDQIDDAAPRTLYVRRDVRNAAAIIAWAKSQGFTSTLDASDLHVTIAYSRVAVDWMKVGEAWNSEMKLPDGGARLVETLGDRGAVVLMFASAELKWRNESIREAGASWDFPEYQPHITITYGGAPTDLSAVEPYRGEIVLGPEIFDEIDDGWAEKVRETDA